MEPDGKPPGCPNSVLKFVSPQHGFKNQGAECAQNPLHWGSTAFLWLFPGCEPPIVSHCKTVVAQTDPKRLEIAPRTHAESAQLVTCKIQVQKRTPSNREHWIEEELPEIKEEVQSDAGLLGYQDEASFQQAGSITRTWCVRGEGCDVKSYPTRKSIKVLGAVVFAKDPKWHFRFAEKFNGDSFLTLLKQMVRQYPDNRIHLITDNVRYHKGSGVRQWLEEQVDHIKLHFLPKYSPKLNAVEYIWRKIKRLTTHNRYFETLEELHAELFRRFNRFQGNPASLRSTVAGFT